MPLLSSEVSVYPAELFDGGPDDLAAGSQWWVLHTKPRQEKALARHLIQHRVPFYLPTIAKRLRVRGRNMTSHVPLFSSYLFLLATQDQRVTALTSNRVVHTLTVNDQTTLWRDLRQIQKLIAIGAPITPEDRLAPGSLVEISSGPLQGLKGKILRTASGRRFVVEVDFIQRGASVVLDEHFLTAAPGGEA